MDNRQLYSESLKNTLSCYQLSSADSLSGPSGYPALAAQLCFKENNQSPPIPPRPPVVQIPLLVPNDTSTKRSETYLSGEKISCFIVGGEKRLCLPQILTTVLKDYSIEEINRTCVELRIYCSRCSPDQLEILKVLGILPFNTTQCGLITKTDAERLLAALGVEFHLNGKQDYDLENSKGIHVYHECFGRGDGIFYPELYLTPDATCITCLDCRSMFSPSRFVLHAHSILENRVCHWGFDRDNWRHYILIPRSVDEDRYNELEKQLNRLKARFDPSAVAYLSHYQLKRRLKTESASGYEISTKRLRKEKEVNTEYPTSTAPASCFRVPFPHLRTSAFKPWGPNVSDLAELQAAQDAAVMSAFVPLIQQDKRFLPSLVQIAAPSGSDWPRPTCSIQETPNVSAQPMDLKKRSSGITSSPQRVQHSDLQRQSGGSVHRDNKLPSISGKQTRQNFVVKTEETSQTGSYPVSCRKTSKDAHKITTSRHGNRNSSPGRPLSDPSKSGHHIPKKNSRKNALTNATSPERSRDSKELQTGADQRSSEEDENTAMKSAVAAASAMLELSSSIENRSTATSEYSTRNLSRNKQHFPPADIRNSSESAYPKVTSLPQSMDHFKWTFSDHSYIISSHGTDELKAFRRLLKSVPDDSPCILEEVVRMKFHYEEKLDLQYRLQRDLEVELERLKKSKQRCLDDAADNTKQLRHELEKMRDDHRRDSREWSDALIQLGKSLASIRQSSTGHDDRDSLQHKILDRLHQQVDDKEDCVRNLERQLLEERDRRIFAERKLEENVGAGRGRISLLMDENFSSIMKSMAQQNTRLCNSSRSPPGGFPQTDDAAVDLSAESSPIMQSSKDSGVHDV